MTRLICLDRHQSADCVLHEPDRLGRFLNAAHGEKLCARGAGLSYVPAGFADAADTVSLKHFDRILDFNAEERWIEVEAGTSLGKLFAFLAPLGLQLPVQPGYPSITVGGCVAANVHGKNHVREGTLRRHVLALTLYHPDHGTLRCSAHENADLFELSVGGLGLTGFITQVRLGLSPLKGVRVEETHIPTASLEEAFRKVGRLSNDSDLIYAWMDLSKPGDPKGQGFITSARILSGPPSGRIAEPEGRLDPNRGELKRKPVFNKLSIPFVNRYYRWRGLKDAKREIGLAQFLFPALGQEIYFHFFGEPGFVESQILLPAGAVESYLADFRRLMTKHGQPGMLTTLKAFGNGQAKLLDYDGDGFSFTIDVANNAASLAWLAELDAVNLAHKAISNLMKDSRLPRDVFQRMYPAHGAFSERLNKFDPKRRFTSAVSQRLGL